MAKGGEGFGFLGRKKYIHSQAKGRRVAKGSDHYQRRDTPFCLCTAKGGEGMKLSSRVRGCYFPSGTLSKTHSAALWIGWNLSLPFALRHPSRW